MTTTRHITVRPRVPTAIVFLRNAFLWTCIVGAAGVSRIWFGGAWVVDLAIVAVILAWLANEMVKAKGLSAELTGEEVRAWLDDGMPEDIRLWQHQRRAGGYRG